MPQFTFVIFYVADVAASTAFYERLLERAPVEASPTFAMFPLAGGVMLGLWGRGGVEPAPSAPAGASEIAFVSRDVDAIHAAWSRRSIEIAQAPADMDFGRTFTALDPDGHRIRVLTPATP